MPLTYRFNLIDDAFIETFEHELAKYRGESKSEKLRNFVHFSIGIIEQYRKEGHVNLTPPTDEVIPISPTSPNPLRWTCERGLSKHPNLVQQTVICEICHTKHFELWRKCQELKRGA